MNRVLTITGNFILILAAAACTMGAVISAFHFTVEPLILFLVWMAAALTASILMYFRQIKGLLFLLIPIAALLIWRFSDITEGAKWVVFYISNDYSNWLFVPVLFSGAGADDMQQTLFFTIVGMIFIFPLTIAICRNRSTFLTILLTAPFVLLTFVHVYSQAQPVFLLGLLGVYYTLLFSSALAGRVQLRSQGDGSRKHGGSSLLREQSEGKQGDGSLHFPYFPLAVFTALALAMILLGTSLILAPRQEFSRNTVVKLLDYHVRSFASRVGLIKVKPGVGWPPASGDELVFDTTLIEISEAGARVFADISLLEVTADKAGTFYLRGYSMRQFDGSSWTVNSDDPPLPDAYWISGIPAQIAAIYERTVPDSALSSVNMSINRTGDNTARAVYIPYYSPVDYQYENTGSFTFYHPEKSISELYEQLPPRHAPKFALFEYSALVNTRDTYLQVGDSTAEGLRRIAEDAGIDLNADRATIASQVALYFSSFGQYTLAPLIVPEDEDFALYFLQQSGHGYCIHYATAATLMLRALDVPARFTVGYVVTIGQNQVALPVVLTDGNVHAWVEVFFDDFGWLPLEVTPPAGAYEVLPGRPQAGAIPLPADSAVENWFGVDVNDPFADTPGGLADGENGGLTTGQTLWREYGLLLLCVLLAVCAATLVIRRVTILFIKKRRFAQPDTNAAVILAWGYLTRLISQQKQALLSKGVKELAYKARFSQHRLSEEERSVVISYTRVFAGDIYKKYGILRRFIIKYIKGL